MSNTGMVRWTAETDARLRKDWNTGFTAEVIRQRFGGDFTRGMIIGRANRLKLDARKRAPAKYPMRGGADMLKALSPEQLGEFKAIWASGASISKIAPLFGMGRSSVSRVAHRLGLEKRELRKAMRKWHADKKTWHGGVHSKRLRPGSQAEPRPPRLVYVAPVAPTSNPVTLMAAKAWQCTWIIGEPKGPSTLYCGAPSTRGSWCAYHVSLGHCAGTAVERSAHRIGRAA